MRSLILGIAAALALASCTETSPSATDAATSAAPSSTTAPSPTPTQAQTTDGGSFAGSVPAPDFPTDLDWLNTSTPISLDQLRGKIVLLDFWTYGCINCIHIIPDLQRLETEYANELVVIGVHSAKFLTEGETDNIREVVVRYGIEHPVVNDRDFAVWGAWGAQAWPTIALIDPAGNVIGLHAGEGVYAAVQPVIEGLIGEFDESIDRRPFDTQPESAAQANTVLSYPGKVAITDSGDRLFISDTGHNRVLAVDAATGEIQAVYGNGQAGFESGASLSAQFDAPQGLAFDDTTATLYVADTNNHAVRAVDTQSGEVTTVAGIGSLGWPPAAGVLPDVRLNSPWGLAFHNNRLWVAMAGSHQIWVIDVAGGIASPTVGSALEGVANGALAEATLAQPSGLAFDDSGRLYFADSESSSIRWADVLDERGTTGLLAGTDRDLFTFGDTDGTGSAARLQHPLGIAWDPQSRNLLVADTYNSKIKRIAPESGATVTFAGGTHGWADGDDPLFYEPGGLALSGRTLFVADTNNHVIRQVDLDTGTTETLVLHGIENFTPPPDAADYPGTIVSLEPVTVAPGPGELVLDVELPDGYKVNGEAPSSIVFDTGGFVAIAQGDQQSLTGAILPVGFDVDFRSGEGDLRVDLTLLYCRSDSEGLCIIEQVRFVRPVAVADGGTSRLVLPHTVELPLFADSAEQ